MRNVPLKFDRKVPEGDPLFPGDARVAEAWRSRARRELRVVRMTAISGSALAVAAAVGGLAPAWVALAAVGAAAVLTPLAVVSVSGRTAQRGFDVFEKGVHATERRRILRFRRFAPFPEIVSGEAREVAPGKYAVALTLLDGSTLESIPGEVSAAGVEYLRERTGDQIEDVSIPSRGEKPGQTL